jgi:hypothetical protein
MLLAAFPWVAMTPDLAAEDFPAMQREFRDEQDPARRLISCDREVDRQLTPAAIATVKLVTAKAAATPTAEERFGYPARIKRVAMGPFVLYGNLKWSTRVTRLR